jgi:hypothetical protein
MKTKTLALIALTIGTAQAQDSILTYQGMDMTGTITAFNQTTMMSVSQAFDASFLVQLDISGSVAANDLKLVSAEMIASHYIFDLPKSLVGLGGPDFCSMIGCIDLTTNSGRITGATIAISGNGFAADIGPAGDSLLYQFGIIGDECVLRFSGQLCTITTANKTPGTWAVKTTSVPEIDPTSAASGLMLLWGILAVLRSKRKELDHCARALC